MNTDPAAAPPRADLPFLTHRSAPRTVPAPPQAAAAISFDRPGRTRPPVPAAGSAGISFDRPGRARPPAPAAGSAGISFDRPGRAAGNAPPPAVSNSLDLSDATPAPQPDGGGAAARRAARVARRPVRGLTVPPDHTQLLGVADPAARLTRVQSGIGTLMIEAACSPAVGDLRLGAAYELADGASSTVQYAAGGNRYAPSSRRPVIVGGRDEFEHLRLDLRQTPDLRRMSVYAFSESRTELRWGGTLVVTTFGGGRVELPLETLHAGTTAVLVSVYNVAGELVVRAEVGTIAGDVREAARAYGYDRITWRDDRNPVD
ncbi:hypothetical protein [uncultured Jatrophihabitans sp.]|uniref:hypothetical protein n=1 Tax=uncultured Jatrophihabitans sp. TaxID=1610747 RepID=UPI0035CB929A